MNRFIRTSAFLVAAGAFSIDCTAPNPLFMEDAKDLAENPPRFKPPVMTNVAQAGLSAVTAGDFNEDRRDDLVATAGSALAVLLGDGSGSFRLGGTYALRGTASGLTAADINRDGLIDVVCTTRGDSVEVFLSRGDGTFAADAITLQGEPSAVAVGDVTGDGLADLVVSLKTANSMAILSGMGNGLFNAPDKRPVGMSPVSVALGDVDSDTHLDAVFADADGRQATILLGPSFVNSTNWLINDGPSDVALADFNADGTLDLVVSAAQADSALVLWNRKNLFEIGHIFDTTRGASSIAVGDFNDDRSPDFAVAEGGGSSVHIFQNAGGESFIDWGRIPVGKNPSDLAILDADGDALPDIAVACGDGAVWIILSRGATPPPDAGATDVGASDNGIDSGNIDLLPPPDLLPPNYPASCLDVHAASPGATDGEYDLYIGKNPAKKWKAYCRDLAGNPREYLSLPNALTNFSQYTAGGQAVGTDVRTYYQKVRVNPSTLMVDVSDGAFATSTGQLNDGSYMVTSMSYAAAMDCAPKGFGIPTGVASVDFRGTKFAVAQKIFEGPANGVHICGSVTYSDNDQVVMLLGGGFCGYWAAGAAAYGQFGAPINGAGTFQMQLVYYP